MQIQFFNAFFNRKPTKKKLHVITKKEKKKQGIKRRQNDLFIFD